MVLYEIGDHVYPLSKNLLTPCAANEIDCPDKDAYNLNPVRSNSL